VLANEDIDAMPVHRFAFKNNSLSEQCVKIENEHFAWCDRAPSPELTLYLETLLEDCSLSADFCSEARPIQSAWLASVAHMLNKGLLLIFDYGYSRREYYRPERNDGTLMCFYQHHMHVDPLQLVGLQDITAHVDFTHLAESALDSGLCVYGFTNQAAFLLSCGILDRAQKESLNSDILKYKQNQSIKSLTLPSQMGEISKVIALGKECDITLIGFSLQDRRQDL
jgi:SAM-dependent MidA family methyltransferase